MMNLTETLSMMKSRQQQDFFSLKSYIINEFPTTVQALRLIDKECTEPKRHKGFNLVKRETKKLGAVYYVRYYHNGEMLPSKWNTHTNVLSAAERFASGNRDRLIERYLRRRENLGMRIFEKFFEDRSAYLACEEKRTRPLSDTTRQNYHSVITTKFLPFLRKRNITAYEKITIKVLGDFQDEYLALGARPQTVNDYLKPVKRVMQYLVRKGYMSGTLYIRNLPVHEDDKIMRGCYELKDLKGVFTKRWTEPRYYLLCLLIYTTGMRNGEIRALRMDDIITMGGCRFVDIKKSKTANGVRLVPLHEKVYQKLKAYGMGKVPDDEPLFKSCSSVTFSEASRELERVIRRGNQDV
jgi:integrase